MIEYVIAENPDDRIIQKAIQELKAGNVIAFPTDTTWVLAASPHSKPGVEKLYRIKGMDRKKHLSLICDSISMASTYAQISNETFRLIRRLLPGPYTFIFEPTKNLPRIIESYRRDRQIGIRIPESKLAQRIVEFFESPLLATSLSYSMLIEGTDRSDIYDPSSEEIYSYMVENAFMGKVEMVIDPGDIVMKGQSTIIDFSDSNVPNIVRKGAGSVIPFGGQAD